MHKFNIKPAVAIGAFGAVFLVMNTGKALAQEAGVEVTRNAPEVIENRDFESGLKLENRTNVVVRNCRIRNRDGGFGVSLLNCKNVRIENCRISRIGNEAMEEKDVRQIKGYEFAPAALDRVAGIWLENSSDITIAGNEITDSVGKGITLVADRWENAQNVVIEGNRIAYVGDDGIDFHTRTPAGGDTKKTLLMRGVVIRGNTIHNVGLGLTRLGFARHGIYLSVRDAVVEGNTIYNCFYGEGISIRNSAVVRNNKVKNCARACIAYWAQTSTEGTSGIVQIENNECQMNFAIPIPMRHIGFPEKLHRLPLGALVIQHNDNPNAQIKQFIVRGNRLSIGADYADAEAVLTGNGDAAQNKALFDIAENVLTDRRAQPNFFRNLPPGADTTRNVLQTAEGVTKP